MQYKANLFSKLNNNFFKILVGKNQIFYSELINTIYQKIYQEVATFKTDKEIKNIIESVMFMFDIEQEDDIKIDANTVLRKLIKYGWLEEDKYGAKRYIYMSSVVAGFVDSLINVNKDSTDEIGEPIRDIYTSLNNIYRIEELDNSDLFYDLLKRCLKATNKMSRLYNGLSADIIKLKEDISRENSIEEMVVKFVEDFHQKRPMKVYLSVKNENNPINYRYKIESIILKLRSEGFIEKFEERFQKPIDDEQRMFFQGGLNTVETFIHSIQDLRSIVDQSYTRLSTRIYESKRYHKRYSNEKRVLFKQLRKVENIKQEIFEEGDSFIIPIFSESLMKQPNKKRKEIESPRKERKKTSRKILIERLIESEYREIYKVNDLRLINYLEGHKTDESQRLNINSTSLDVSSILNYRLFNKINRLCNANHKSKENFYRVLNKYEITVISDKPQEHGIGLMRVFNIKEKQQC